MSETRILCDAFSRLGKRLERDRIENPSVNRPGIFCKSPRALHFPREPMINCQIYK